MSKAFSHEKTKGHDEWLTPKYITDALGPFDLDPCSPIVRPWDTAKKHYTVEDDGLSKKWHGRVWCNPPYGPETKKWLERIASHGDGIALVFSRTETGSFFPHVWAKADSIFFFKGRLCFSDVKGQESGTAGAPSCLISYGKENTKSIRSAMMHGKIKGVLIPLDHSQTNV
jgi:hypothetical protein